MTLISCPECEEPVSEGAKSCPNCGFRLARLRWKARVLRWTKRVMMATAGLLALGLLLSMADSALRNWGVSGSGPSETVRQSGIDACIDSIGQERTLADAVRISDPHFGSLGSGRYLIEGTAEMTYRSGLTLEKQYRCVATREQGTWKVTKREID